MVINQIHLKILKLKLLNIRNNMKKLLQKNMCIVDMII